MEESGNSKSRARYYLRVLRPLFYWFLFVLILFGIRTHQRLMERTRLYFDLTLQGRQERYLQSLLDAGDTAFGAAATFDGKPIANGDKILLGYHTFQITHPKTEPFSTNLFIWYGGHNFGVIDLKRAKGTLAVTADPPAPLIFIQGPEYSVTLTNSPGITTPLQLYNYETATVTLSIAANQTNAVRTNLVSLSYASAMRAARQFMNDGRYDEAAQSLADALGVQPGDSAATALQKEAIGLGGIARAESLGKQGDYIAGIDALNKALAVLPENERAKRMLVEFKQHEPEQRVRLEQEHIEAWTNTFNAFTDKITGAGLVETHELKTTKPANEVQAAIAEQFRSVAPTFKLSHVGWTNELFFMDADQEVSGGGRLCMIVGAQIKDGDTRIRFKVIEYKSEAFGLKILGAVLATATSTTYQSNYKPINPSDSGLSDSDKKRISEGVQLVTDKIQQGIGSLTPRK